jgi:hypothetical protein
MDASSVKHSSANLVEHPLTLVTALQLAPTCTLWSKRQARDKPSGFGRFLGSLGIPATRTILAAAGMTVTP